MIANIIRKRSWLLSKIEKAGINKSNLSCVLLYGSHYWGYDSKDSDIDLYVVVKKDQVKVKSIGKISLQYQITAEEVNKRIQEGSWASYFCCRYASYLLHGKRPEISDYPRNKVISYLENKSNEVDELLNKSCQSAFQILMKRLFFLNYFYNSIYTFKLTDFKLSRYLNQKDIIFLEEQYVKLFRHIKEDTDELKQIKLLVLKVEAVIRKKAGYA